MKKVIAVIGDALIDENSAKFKYAFNLGKHLVDCGYRVQSGGLNGVMKAVFMGAKSSINYIDGDTIAIIPSFDKTKVNEYADIVIPTGLDILRNGIVVNADAVISIGGGAGTLSEMAIAWSLGKLILAYNNVDGWSRKLSDTKLDERVRYEDIEEDRIYGISNEQEAVMLLDKYVDKYIKQYDGIKYRV